MKKIAQFQKVSYEQFSKDWKLNITENETLEIYNKIILPKRATIGSAGYDFYSPISVKLNPKESLLIPTGIRVKIDIGWVLKCYPRSSLGFKFRLQLDNSVAIIDSDYYQALNEGHIMFKITNDSNEDKILEIKEGTAFTQGIFVEYGITTDDECIKERYGGFGSTDSKKL